MRDDPSNKLVDLLDRLGLASREQVVSVRRQAKRLAGDLPLFDTIWIDALAQSRQITPYQAQTLAAGSGDRLGIGPYTVLEQVLSLGYADLYRARERATRCVVTLFVAEVDPSQESILSESFAQLISRQKRGEATGIASITDWGIEADHVWAASRLTAAIDAHELLLRNGRAKPEAVLESARQMAATLAQLQQCDVVHGDLHAKTVRFGESGHVELLAAGLRPILRPVEGYAQQELPPDAYDYLAPERIERGSPPDIASDLYACGALWWHLLTGRSPLAGGNSLRKLKAAHQAKIPDVRRLAPETPDPLARAIRTCLEHDPRRRPESFAELSAALGPSTREGRSAVAQFAARRQPQNVLRARSPSLKVHSAHTPVWLAAAAGSALMLAVATWPLWRPAVNVASADRPTPTQHGDSSTANHGNPVHGQSPHFAREDQAIFDPMVSPAAHVEQVPARSVVLSSEASIEAGKLRLTAGQHVAPAAGRRATIVVPPGSWQLSEDNLTFENINFVAAQPAGSLSQVSQALIVLRAANITFHGCTFNGQGVRPAIRWEQLEARPDELATASRMQVAGCIFRNVTAAVVGEVSTPVLLEADNTLYLGSGAFIEAEAFPGFEQGLLVSLSRCTFRGGVSLIDFQERAAGAPGKVTIQATSCVFAMKHEPSLLRFFGSEPPADLLSQVRWSGQGSLLASDIDFATYYDEAGARHPADDSQVSVEGLVRGTFDFFGPAEGSAENSSLDRWVAPLRSPDPPGIRVATQAATETATASDAAYRE